MVANYFTTADDCDNHGLLAEIGVLHDQISDLTRQNSRMRAVLDFLENQPAVFTPAFCWTPGGGTLQDRVREKLIFEDEFFLETNRKG